MEQIQLPEVNRRQPEAEASTGNCVNCEVRIAEPGYNTNLCAACRTHLIKFPIPLWIKLFASGVCLVILFSLYTFPDHLSTAIHLSRGKKAADDNRFVTAHKEFQKVVNKYPEHVEARAQLMLASFYNEDYQTFVKYSQELNGLEIENKNLLSKLIDAQNTFEAYTAIDSVYVIQKQYEALGQPLPDSILSKFIANHPADVAAQLSYAMLLHSEERFGACDSILVQLLEQDDTHITVLQLMANTKRRLKDYNAAIKYCQRVFEINKESAHTYAILARAHFENRRDKEGLEAAAKAISIDDKDPFVRATMALAYHFTNQFERRDEMVREAKAAKDSALTNAFGYVIDVLEHKIQFR